MIFQRKDPIPDMPELNTEEATAIMANVFAACEQQPSTVPLDVLMSYIQYRRDRYRLEKMILIGILVLFLLMPVCFVMPEIDITQIAVTPTGIPTYQVQVNNTLHVRLASATLNGHSIPVYETQAGVFNVEPNENGELEITIMLANRQYCTETLQITGIDATTPELVGSELVSGRIRIFAKDEGVGTNFGGAYAISTSGSRITPVAFTDEGGYVEFPFDRDMNIFIPDRNGNTLQLVLTVK